MRSIIVRRTRLRNSLAILSLYYPIQPVSWLSPITAQPRMHGPRPAAGSTPHCRHAPGAVAAALADTECGVRFWLVAAAEYQQGPAGHMCMHVKTGMHMRPGQGPAWSCIYCKRLALPPPTSACGASGRGAPQSTTRPAPGPRAPSRLWDLAQCAARIGFEAETAAFAEGNFNIIRHPTDHPKTQTHEHPLLPCYEKPHSVLI